MTSVGGDQPDVLGPVGWVSNDTPQGVRFQSTLTSTRLSRRSHKRVPNKERIRFVGSQLDGADHGHSHTSFSKNCPKVQIPHTEKKRINFVWRITVWDDGARKCLLLLIQRNARLGRNNVSFSGESSPSGNQQQFEALGEEKKPRKTNGSSATFGINKLQEH